MLDLLRTPETGRCAHACVRARVRPCGYVRARIRVRACIPREGGVQNIKPIRGELPKE